VDVRDADLLQAASAERACYAPDVKLPPDDPLLRRRARERWGWLVGLAIAAALICAATGAITLFRLLIGR
jgi:hypothetical protein